MVARALIARGDAPRLRPAPLPSPLPGVSSEAWTAFVRALATQGLSDVSESNGLGCWEMRPRRLGDLGLVEDLHVTRTASGRQVWDGQFVFPLSREKFLQDPVLQYSAFVRSIQQHDREIKHGVELPSGMTRAGALAVLHRIGPSGLRSFGKSKFEATAALYERARGCF